MNTVTGIIAATALVVAMASGQATEPGKESAASGFRRPGSCSECHPDGSKRFPNLVHWKHNPKGSPKKAVGEGESPADRSWRQGEAAGETGAAGAEGAVSCLVCHSSEAEPPQSKPERDDGHGILSGLRWLWAPHP